jgi:putative transposase
MHDKHLIVEEPCEGKLSRTVLKTSGAGDSLAEFNNSLPAFKEVRREYKECNCMTLQATLKRVDYAFQRWFKGLGKRPKYKSIRHYSGWTYPSKTGWKAHTNGVNGYLELAKIGFIQMRGKARIRKHRHRLVNYMYFLFRAIKLDWFGSCRVCGQANRQAATNSW